MTINIYMESVHKKQMTAKKLMILGFIAVGLYTKFKKNSLIQSKVILIRAPKAI